MTERFRLRWEKRRSRPVIRFALAGAALLVSPAGALAQDTGPGSQASGTGVISTADPCIFAPEDQLKYLLAGAIGLHFPMTRTQGGDSVRLANPALAAAQCPGLHLDLGAELHRSRARPGSRDSARGQIRWTARVVARVIYSRGPTASRVRATDLRQALACLTDVEVTAISLPEAPIWLGPTWLRDRFARTLGIDTCVDITSLVYVHLRRGGTL